MPDMAGTEAELCTVPESGSRLHASRGVTGHMTFMLRFEQWSHTW